MESQPDRSRQHDIPAGMELRFEGIDKQDVHVVLSLVEGQCECFGTPLVLNKQYSLPHGAKGALAAVGGPCKVRFMNTEALRSVKEGNPHSGDIYSDLLSQLNARRAQAAAEGTAGPNILVCGQTDTGKSTLCKYLVNSAIKANHSLCFLDCDLGQNSITCPGSVSAVFLEDTCVDIEEGLTLLMPLSYFFGELSLTNENLGKYNHLCSQAGACIRANAENRQKFRSGGVVVNTMGWVEDLGYSAIKLIMDSLQIDTVVVMDNPQLEDRLRSECDKAKVVGFAKAGGVVERPKQYRKTQREERVLEYFKGVNTMLRPVKVVVPFSELYLFRVGATVAEAAQQNVPPYHAAVPVVPDSSLNLSLAAVSHASCREELAHANVAGFVLILNVDIETQQFTLLLPSGNSLPRRFLLVSKIHARYSDLQ